MSLLPNEKSQNNTRLLIRHESLIIGRTKLNVYLKQNVENYAVTAKNLKEKSEIFASVTLWYAP